MMRVPCGRLPRLLEEVLGHVPAAAEAGEEAPQAIPVSSIHILEGAGAACAHELDQLLVGGAGAQRLVITPGHRDRDEEDRVTVGGPAG
jgi:hypothetical protein